MRHLTEEMCRTWPIIDLNRTLFSARAVSGAEYGTTKRLDALLRLFDEDNVKC